MKPSLEVADIFRMHGSDYRARYQSRMPLQHKRTMRAIEICRTALLGGHVDECASCGQQRISYNSCRNRHCPKCQFLRTERWIEARTEDLLPIPYFHIVFTLPEELRAVALANQRVVYDLLFKAASETLIELGQDPKHLGAHIGLIAVLHTWSQTLIHHPHVHCIVTGGGLTDDGKWRASRSDFFLPVKVISRLYRGKFLAKLRLSELKVEVSPLYRKEWTVYAKRSFNGIRSVVDYLGRYTHRIAISNHRLTELTDEAVTFRYRDSTDHSKQKTMKLGQNEFIRRFLLHVLPAGFVKIRHYGILANRGRRHHLAVCRRELLGTWQRSRRNEPRPWQDILKDLTGVDVNRCTSCGGRMDLKERIVPMRAPPAAA